MAKSLVCREPSGVMASCFVPGTEIAEAVRKICPGKTILGIFSGRLFHQDWNGIFRLASGFSLGDYLIATPDHILFWERGESGQTIRSIRYPDITAIEYQAGLIFGDVIIRAQGINWKFGDVSLQDISRIRCIVSERRDYFRNPSFPSHGIRVQGIPHASGLFSSGNSDGWMAPGFKNSVHS